MLPCGIPCAPCEGVLFLRSAYFLVGLISAASAAALVPVPTPPQPALPPAGLEVNQGQAKAGILFLWRGANNSLAVEAQSVLYSPVGAALSLVGSNSNPAVSYSDALPGLANYYSGANPAMWVTGVARYSTATLAGVYPGVNAQYTVDASGVVTLTFSLAAGVSVQSLQFAIAQAVSLKVGSSGGLTFQVGSPPGPEQPTIVYPAPVASQGSGANQVNLAASFAVQSATSFGIVVQGVDTTQPVEISIPLSGNAVYNPPPVEYPFAKTIQQASDSAGNNYYAMAIADAAGSSVLFPSIPGVGCDYEVNASVACSDVAVYKYSAAGTLQFITYLSGQYDETAGFVGVASTTGNLVIAGTTDSANFPATASAVQPAFAGPTATPKFFEGGDFFAAILDPASGHLQAATFLGGPNADTMGTAALGADGSLYFLPAHLVNSSANMPVTVGALQSVCQNDPCGNGYVAHLSPGLDRLLYGTYLPGGSTAQLYSDGSVYYAGTAQAGFPTTPNAYQPQNAGGYDGIIGRLDPTGSTLIFATYFGGPYMDSIFPIAVAPDGSVWAGVNSEIGCCSLPGQLIHLDAGGSKLLADVPINALDMVVDHAGNLYTFADGAISASPGALLGGSCGAAAYVEISPAGQQLFATYLPVAVSGFVGADAQGTPYLGTSSGAVQVVPSLPGSTAPYAGCMVDAADFGTEDQGISPGEIVAIFGSGLGPSPGVGYLLVDGKAPMSLGGTQVLVNGEPASILYSSYGQVNLILPYSLTVATKPSIEVFSNGTPANALSSLAVQAAGITIFQVNNAAAALNQDGTINSPQNPARPGSTVALFGTGGGQTSRASVAGEITPLGLWPLMASTQVQVAVANLVTSGASTPDIALSVQYAGAAPGLLAGVTQLNVTLPSVIPATYSPPGVLQMFVNTNGEAFGFQTVTIFVVTN